MLDNDEIAQQIAERLYPGEALRAANEALCAAGRDLLAALGFGISEYTTLGAAMQQLQNVLDTRS